MSRATDSGVPVLAGHVPDVVPPDQRDAFLRLPLAAREVAVVRLNALAEFADAHSGKTALAAKLAKQLEMSRSRFYELAKLWDETRSVDVLVPYATAKVSDRRRQSRLDDHRLNLLRQTIASVLRNNPIASKSEVYEEIVKNFEKSALHIPSFSTTARAYDAYIVASLPSSPQQRLKRLREPEEYGSALAIDHADIFFGADSCLTLTLVIDAFTGTIAGLALGHGAPNVHSVASALLSAIRKPLIPPSAAFTSSKSFPKEPLVVMNVSKDPEWRRFASVIEQIDGGIDARAYNYIMTGTFAFSLIGKRLGHYDLRYRRMNRSGLGDIRWKPVADIAIIRSVEAAAREYNRRKLAPLEKPGAPVALPPALFGVRGPELQDYLEDLLQNS